MKKNPNLNRHTNNPRHNYWKKNCHIQSPLRVQWGQLDPLGPLGPLGPLSPLSPLDPLGQLDYLHLRWLKDDYHMGETTGNAGKIGTLYNGRRESDTDTLLYMIPVGNNLPRLERSSDERPKSAIFTVFWWISTFSGFKSR